MKIPKLSNGQKESFKDEMNQEGFVVLQKTSSGYRVLRDTRLVFVNADMEEVTMSNTDKIIYMEDE